jgi:tRNA dimethylallyltransferase
MIPCVRGEYTIEDAAERIRLGTRHYAKRQMTFLRREEQMQYVDVESTGAYEEIRRILI